jgi:short subunit fatty acids transporter
MTGRFGEIKAPLIVWLFFTLYLVGYILVRRVLQISTMLTLDSLLVEAAEVYGVLLVFLVVFVALTIIGPIMHPKKGEEIEADAALVKETAIEPPVKPKPEEWTPALRIENSPIINLVVGISGLVWLFWHFGQRGWAGINLDVGTSAPDFFSAQGNAG